MRVENLLLAAVLGAHVVQATWMTFLSKEKAAAAFQALQYDQKRIKNDHESHSDNMGEESVLDMNENVQENEDENVLQEAEGNGENDENEVYEGIDHSYSESDSDLNSAICLSNVFDYKKNKVLGVNLGGWLVTEPFISPSLYQNASPDGTEVNVPIDEYNFGKQLGYHVAHERLKQHWETWITEDDLAAIKGYGFNAVRLPIGYWAFKLLPDDPYVTGQEEYLANCIQWCRNQDLKLWIDLHGIPGSQNGFDNSGQRGVLNWIDNKQNYDLGIEVLNYIFKTYGGPEYEDVIIGIQNLNEPMGTHYPISLVEKFNEDTFALMRTYSQNNFVYHNAFVDPEYWNGRMDYENVVLDNHHYEVFTPPNLRKNVEEHIENVALEASRWLSLSKVQIIGEWSAALTDCAHWLNGVGRKNRYENTFQGDGSAIGQCTYSNDVSKMTPKNREDTIRFIKGQQELYSKLNGYFFWTWKTENAIEWSLKDLIKHGLFNVPVADPTKKN